jgi:hypothetical protein
VALYSITALLWIAIRSAVVSFRVALGIAILLRALFLFAEPTLSGDVYRYLWDGTVLRSGTNPYRYAPSDARLAPLRASWHPHINHPQIRTIYPPHAQLLFALVHRLTWWRLLMIGCDAVTLVLLRAHPRALLAFATFPPLLFEGTWSGHIEVIAAMLLTFAVVRRSPSAWAVAVGLKITPVAALPSIWRDATRKQLLSAMVVLVLPFAVFASCGPLMPGFRDYATRWVFNSPAYTLLFPVADWLPLKAWWTAVKDPLHLETVSDVVYRHLYADFVTRALLACCASSAILWVARRRMTLAHAAITSIAALLLFSPTIHPWYWLVIAPLAIAFDSRLLWFALAAPASYLLYDGTAPLLVFALCYGLPAAAVILRRARLRRAESC